MPSTDLIRPAADKSCTEWFRSNKGVRFVRKDKKRRESLVVGWRLSRECRDAKLDLKLQEVSVNARSLPSAL